MEIPLYNVNGQQISSVQVSDELFGATPNDHAIYLDVKQYLANQRQGTHKAKERGEVSGSTKKPYKQKGTGNARAGHKRSPLWRHGGRVFGPRPRDYRFKLNQKLKLLARRSAMIYKIQENNLLLVENFTYQTLTNETLPKTKVFLKFLKDFNVQNEKVLFVLPALPQLPKAPDTRKKRGLYVEGYIPKKSRKPIITYKEYKQKLASSVEAYNMQKAIFDEQYKKNKMLYLAARNLPKVTVITPIELHTYNIMNAGKIIMMKDAWDNFVSNITK
ncbi:MAG: 50S ribosomal protein L4 [Bacteroidia bacterium]|nr:50S ribosomal protein L4 [Bacteroidia bacterium]MDW8347407.1 50S ribosomal protein L4 [Bacteroidia bacterium]